MNGNNLKILTELIKDIPSKPLNITPNSKTELESLLKEVHKPLTINQNNISQLEEIIYEVGMTPLPEVKLNKPKKLILKNFQAPGDIITLTTAVRDLHLAHPGKYLTDIRTSTPEIWEYNPNITKIDDKDLEAEHIQMEYPLIHQSNQGAYPFIHGFTQFLESKLGIKIPVTKFAGDIYIADKEKAWFSAPREILGKDVPYWVIDAGHKTDYTAKQWGFLNWQTLVTSCPDITFVQIGHKAHIHPTLVGKNLINLVGKTDNRQLIRLVYNAFGVVTPCSLPMVLAYSIPPHPRFNRKSRACIVIGAGREPNQWQAAPNQQYVHTCGMLPCCDSGGCWRSRVVKLNDGQKHDESICFHPVKLMNGETIPLCMKMITPMHIKNLINNYMENYVAKV